MLRCRGPTGRKQTVPEFVAVGVTTLKHCLGFLSRLADGIDNLQCGKVNPMRKMIDTKIIEKIQYFLKYNVKPRFHYLKDYQIVKNRGFYFSCFANSTIFHAMVS